LAELADTRELEQGKEAEFRVEVGEDAQIGGKQ